MNQMKHYKISSNFSNLVKIIDDHVDKEEDLENPRLKVQILDATITDKHIIYT